MPNKIPRIAVASILIAFAGWTVAQVKPSETRQIRRLEYRLSDYQRFTGSGLQILAVSPDGGKLAFGTQNGLYLCSGNPMTAALIPGTQGITAQPFFSPDGKSVVHAELEIGNSRFFLGEEMPGCKAQSPGAVGGLTGTYYLYVDDADAFVKKAVGAGATIAGWPPGLIRDLGSR